MMRDANRRCGSRHREPFAALLGGAIGVDAVHPPQRAPIRFSQAAISSSDHRIARPRITARGLFGGTAAMLDRLRFAYPQL